MTITLNRFKCLDGSGGVVWNYYMKIIGMLRL